MAQILLLLSGGVHGAGQACENLLQIKKAEKHDICWMIRCVCVFVFVTFAWIFFRAVNIHEVLYVFRHMFSGLRNIKSYIMDGAHSLGVGKIGAIKIMVLYLMPLLVYDFFSLKGDICEWLGKRKVAVRYVYTGMMAILILLFGYVGKSTFVYFQF